MDMNGPPATLFSSLHRDNMISRSERPLESLQTDPEARHGAWCRVGPAPHQMSADRPPLEGDGDARWSLIVTLSHARVP